MANHDSADNSWWYKDAVIYAVHVKSFFDNNNDGIGDFAGLSRKLGYLQNLGVSCVSLLPFYPSPLRDDGYDVADYRSIHPAYGTLEDFIKFLNAAHALGLRVITELVLNHTSDQHTWFKEARRSRDNPRRNWYVWSDSDDRYAGVRIIFADTEKSNWAWDPESKQYYWHRFFSYEPDLNYDNPEVREEMWKVMKFWLDLGVDGFRIDAVPYLIERAGTSCENVPETHEVLKFLRNRLNEHFTDRMLIAEANQKAEDVRRYFGTGDECHMCFNYPLVPSLFLAVRQEDSRPIIEIVTQTLDIPENCQWGIFLRNQNELMLDMLTNEDRDYMYAQYAADPQARLNRGIRRRLATLLENSRPRIELFNSLLLSMPGTPIIYYGDEVGMGDNIYLGDRYGIRTPMQWNGSWNAGFSEVDPERLSMPLISNPLYGYGALNVSSQEHAQFSLLNWMRRIIALRRRYPVFGRGDLRFVPCINRKVVAYLRSNRDTMILCVANLSRLTTVAQLDLHEFAGSRFPLELFGQSEFPPIGDDFYSLTLGPYAFHWFEMKPLAEDDPQRVQFYSCFISYSTRDQEFADRLYRDLLEHGVRCWFAPHDVQGGQKLHRQIDEAIRSHERVLLIVSSNSMASEWVKTEIAKARQREIRDARQVLFPIGLASFDAIRTWECFDADTGKDSAREIREYFIPDFSRWREEGRYQEAFQKLLEGLRSSRRGS